MRDFEILNTTTKKFSNELDLDSFNKVLIYAK
jgi:uncharacterized protein YneR